MNIRFFCFIFSISALSACGWQLRGAQTPDKEKNIANESEYRVVPQNNESTSDAESLVENERENGTNDIATNGEAEPTATKGDSVEADLVETAAAKEPNEKTAKSARLTDSRTDTAADIEATPRSAAPNINTRAVNIIYTRSTPTMQTAMDWALRENNIPQANNAAKKITIYNEEIEKRPLVYSETGIPLRYRLLMSVDFSIKDYSGKMIVPRRSLLRWRNYDFDATQIAATVQEESILRAELSEEIAYQILSF